MGNDKMSIKEAWNYNWRGWKLYAKYAPALLAAILCEEFLAAAMPYAGIWLSARFVDELAAGAAGTVLLKLAAAIVFVEFALAFLKNMVAQWRGFHGSRLFWINHQPYMEKFLELDYPNISDQHTHDLSSQIRQNTNMDGYGTIKTIDILQGFVGAVFQIAGGIGLTVSLFTLKVLPESRLSFLNSPLCGVILLALLLGVTALSNWCSVKKNGFLFRCMETLKRSNEIAVYFGMEVPYEKERAEDMRIYRQQERLGNYFISEAPESMGVFFGDGTLGKRRDGAVGGSGGRSFHGSDGSNLSVCVRKGMGGRVRRRRGDAVCRGDHKAVFRDLYADGLRCEYAAKRRVPENYI